MIRIKHCLLAGAALLPAVPARAVLIEKVKIENSYSGAHFIRTYDPSAEGSLDIGGTTFKERVPGTWMGHDGSVANRAEYGIDYVGEVNEDTGSFYFLHNNYCVGTCSTASRTIITFTIRNDGDTPQALRFDSLITPGHLARMGVSDANEAGFTFTVTQDPDSLARQLYEATGYVSSSGINVTTPAGLPLSSLSRIERNGWEVLDWGATNLNLNLGMLGSKQTTVVRYEARYFSRNSTVCLDLATCSGAQVVFGDPRSDGGGMNRMSLAAFAKTPARDVIDPAYNGYRTSFAVVTADTDLAPAPDPLPKRRYGNPFTPLGQAPVASAVPESGTWALMLGGFGLMGAAMRRRRVAVSFG